MLSKVVKRVLFKSPVAFTQARSFAASKGHFYNILQLDDTRAELRETFEKFAQEECAPIAEEMDKTMVFPHEMWKKLGDMGMLGITVEEEYGGMGLGYYEHCLAVEEVSKANAGLGLSYLAHSNLCVNQIRLNGSEEQKHKYLPKLISGDHVGALAMSEPGSGSDVTSMKLRADLKGDKYVLNGSKMWITNGPTADVLVVYAKTDVDAGHRGISAFIIEKGMKGFSIAQKLDKLGMRGSETGELVFEDCEVPKENLLGNTGSGVYVLMKGLDYERLILAAGALGISQASVDVSLDYLCEREQFGKKLGEFQILQAKMADMYARLQSSRAMVYQSATMFDAGVKSNVDSASVFLHASRSAVRCSEEAVQIYGGNGYINEYPCGRLFRDAKLYDIGGGTVEIRQWLIGRELFKQHQN